ncbi:MAG: glycosyltransferase family 9 protein [Ignavibacteriaceae bacterium]|nr:glycosyltransferase family 9 protein [Ignavibacteriaceae bacterium]
MDAQYLEILKTGDKLLLIQTAFIGDCILTLPLIAALKEKLPGVIIDIVTTPNSQEIFESYDAVNRVYSFDKKGKDRPISAVIAFAGMLKKENYKLVISAHRSARTSLLVTMLGIKESYGFENSSMKFVYSNTIPYEYEKHEAHRNLRFLGEIAGSINPETFRYNLAMPESEAKLIEEVITGAAGKKIVVVAPGTEWNTKQYPMDYFSSVCGYLLDKGYLVAVNGSKKDSKLAEKLAADNGNNLLNLCGSFSIPGTINLLRHCELLISNDSSPVHMGLIAGIKVLTLYCSTVPEFGFYPLGKGSSWLSVEDLDCKPCGIHGRKHCPLEHFNCGRLLLPELVTRKIDELLDNDIK